MDLLFHFTNSLETLKSIVQNGFYPSYAKESFAGREQKLLMVSFSYQPIEEAKRDITYGNYKIGVSMEWAEKNNIHPVHYTFRGSQFENQVLNLIEIGTAGMTLDGMVAVHQAKGPIKTNGFFLDKMKAIATSGINQDQAAKIMDVNNYVTNAAFNLLFFIKNYRIQLKEGTTHTAFFDREWRFVPGKGLRGYPILMPKETFGKEHEDYKHWENEKKPHGLDIPLKIDLEDIKFILVAKDDEINTMRTFLEELFTKERIDALLDSGRLEIGSLIST